MVSTRVLETSYLYEFWTFLVFDFGGFGSVFGLLLRSKKKKSLDVSVLGGLASESAEMPELELAEPGSMNQTSGTRTSEKYTLSGGYYFRYFLFEKSTFSVKPIDCFLLRTPRRGP
mgnify:CR=1 FL=1